MTLLNYMHAKKILISLCLVYMALSVYPSAATMAAEDTLERAQIRMACSLASMATYHQELNTTVENMLRNRGWTAVQYYKLSPEAEAKYTLFRTADDKTDCPIRILAFTGTENELDAAVDLRIHRIPFGGHSTEEFILTAGQKSYPEKTPLVHKGFNDYTQAALFSKPHSAHESMTIGEYLAYTLKSNPDEKLYLTGHSLGGAVAVLAAARLSDLGVSPDQLDVITFGSPAVGNEAFAEAYDEKFHLERVIMQGDPVKYVIQAINGGYVQFGDKKYLRPLPETEQFPHQMVVYLDGTIRDYYDILQNTEENITERNADMETPVKVCIAFRQPKLDDSFGASAPYIKKLLKSETAEGSTCIVYAEEETRLKDICRTAINAGCKYVILHELEGQRLKDSTNVSRITMTETIYDTNCNLLTTYSASTLTSHMTPIEAAAYVYEYNSENRKEIFNSLSLIK